jgi:hypothetical protein
MDVLEGLWNLVAALAQLLAGMSDMATAWTGKKRGWIIENIPALPIPPIRR